MAAADFDQMLFDAGMEEFFDLAFKREREGSMTIDQIGGLFPSRLTPMSPWQQEDLEIEEMYREADERFFAEQALRSEEIEDHWQQIQDDLELREERRKAHVRKKRMLRN